MRVYVLSRPSIDTIEIKDFLDDINMPWKSDARSEAELLCELAGRVCYMSFAKPRPGGVSAYFKHIKESGHGSILEHASWTFLITGVSRSLTHELVRHRAGFAFSQLSQRYVDESNTEFIEPDIIASDHEMHTIWSETMQQIRNAYIRLYELLEERLQQSDFSHRWLPSNASATDKRKIARQAARSVLPNATETKIVVTANARSWRHFVEQRCSRHADYEIRKLANTILDILSEDAPNLFNDYQCVPLNDGTYEITTNYRKV
jgi:thymidylate synthase (FAD)